MYKITCIGNVTADPVLNAREWTNKSTGEILRANVCNFSIGANEGYGERKTQMFFRLNAWRGLADLCKKYLSKGRQVYVEGVPSLKSYQDKTNTIRSAIEIRVERIEFLQDGKRIMATEETVTEEPDFEDTPY